MAHTWGAPRHHDPPPRPPTPSVILPPGPIGHDRPCRADGLPDTTAPPPARRPAGVPAAVRRLRWRLTPATLTGHRRTRIAAAVAVPAVIAGVQAVWLLARTVT